MTESILVEYAPIPVDEEERTRLIRRVLLENYQEFTTYLSNAVALTEAIPDEINNQIRNAFTHLARAQSAEDQESLHREVEKAISHIQRANRDCLKVAIIGARKEIQSLLADVFYYYGTATPEITNAYKHIKKQRKEVYTAEARGENDVVNRLESLLSNMLDLSENIQKSYSEASTNKTRVLRFLKRNARPVLFVIGVGAGLILRPYIAPLLEVLLGVIKSFFSA